jgi:hypothetical protein
MAARENSRFARIRHDMSDRPGKAKKKRMLFQLLCPKTDKKEEGPEKAVDSTPRFLYFAASLLDG